MGEDKRHWRGYQMGEDKRHWGGLPNGSG
jgi:hypothetical protein